eukprot:3349949-Rhodomonas_salina.1
MRMIIPDLRYQCSPLADAPGTRVPGPAGHTSNSSITITTHSTRGTPGTRAGYSGTRVPGVPRYQNVWMAVGCNSQSSNFDRSNI